MFTRDNHITIPGFAITELKLNGNELICYSIIYGLSQDGESEFYGSLSYLERAMNVQRSNVRRILARLLEKGLIEKREVIENKVKRCRYSVVKKEGGCSQNDYGGVVKMTTNNIEDNIKDNITPLISPQGETPQESISKNKKSAKAKPSAADAPLVLPFSEHKTVSAWYELCAMPKWKNKPKSALEKSLKILSRFSEQDALEAIEDAIAGNFQGIFPKNRHPAPPAKKYVNVEDIM